MIRRVSNEVVSMGDEIVNTALEDVKSSEAGLRLCRDTINVSTGPC